MLRLYTFTISHFSEKARWALDVNGISYEEKRLLPGVHVLTVRRKARKTTVPVLDHDGRIVQGSSDILDYIEQSLGKKHLALPEADEKRARELEALADKAFGLGTQRIFYDELLRDRKSVIEMWSDGGPSWARAFYAVSWRIVEPRVRGMYKAFPKPIAEAKELYMRAFDEIDAALAGGKRYLFGDRITRADITVASLLAPTCRPPEHVMRWPTKIPPALDALVREVESRPTYQHVLRMYREHRRV
jgi:glutathione S-transferase